MVEISNLAPKTIIHPLASIISFNHKKEIMSLYNDIIGLCHIDYVSVEIFFSHELVYFSSQPSLGYNLITKGLWQYDGCWDPMIYKNNSFYLWENAYCKNFYDELKKWKEEQYHYTVGFILVRKVSNFFVIYSFATKNKNKDTFNFYINSLNDLLKMGDYCFNLLLPIYAKYSSLSPPKITCFEPYKEGPPIDCINSIENQKREPLKLIVCSR